MRPSDFRRAIIGVGISFLLISCTQQQQSKNDAQSKAPVSWSEGLNEMTGTSAPKTVPQDYPLPVYPGATLGNTGWRGLSTPFPGTTAKMSKDEFWTSDAVGKVSEFYRRELPSMGWKVKSNRFGVFLLQKSDLDGNVLVDCEISPESGHRGETVVQLIFTSPQGARWTDAEIKAAEEQSKHSPTGELWSAEEMQKQYKRTGEIKPDEEWQKQYDQQASPH